MNQPIIETHASSHLWVQPLGQQLLSWSQTQMDHAVADVFGYHALQLGFPALDALRTSRIQNRWFAHTEASPPQEPCPPMFASLPGAVAWMDSTALPIASQSLDLVILPHTLEQSPDPHASLREVERVLVPEGKVVICGLNPWSLWGWRHQRARALRRLGWGGEFVAGHVRWFSLGRVRDWLNLLGFDMHTSGFGGYRPAFDGESWLERCRWMDEAGDRWWPFLGAVYCLVAIKRVRGLRLLRQPWHRTSLRGQRAVTTPHASGRQAQSSQTRCGVDSPCSTDP